MEPNPRTPDAVLLNASMEARVTLRVEHSGYTSPESASRALEEATHGLHVAAATALSSVAIKRAYAKISAAMETLVASPCTRRGRREGRSGNGRPRRGRRCRGVRNWTTRKRTRTTMPRGRGWIPERWSTARWRFPGRRKATQPRGADAAGEGVREAHRPASRGDRPRAPGPRQPTPPRGAAPCLGPRFTTPPRARAVDAVVALCRRSKKAHPRARIVDDVDATDRDGFRASRRRRRRAPRRGESVVGARRRASTTQRSGPRVQRPALGGEGGDPRVLAEVRDASGAEATRGTNAAAGCTRGRNAGGPSGRNRRTPTPVQVRASFPVRRRFTSRRVTAASARYASCCGTPRTRARRWTRETAPDEPRSPPPPPRASTRRCLRWRRSSGSRRTTGTGTGRKVGTRGRWKRRWRDGNGDGNDDVDAENVVGSLERPPGCFPSPRWNGPRYDSRAER